MLKEIILKNRSYRRFYEDVAIDMETMQDLVDLARLSASGANLQPLKYILSCEPQKNSFIFRNLSWAGYLADWPGPPEGERPSGYVIILGDTVISKNFGCDHGIAAQSILLGAAERGLGGCMINSVNRIKLRKDINIPDRYKILLVLAIGKPKEKVVIETLKYDGDIRYWRDISGVHHVPKRSLEEIIIG